ncbi:MAG TPA: autotransporter-associated beta strand repeat-containing protein, partial [Phycisphaerae bacterium]|nr:autotransporter-associated beta strand repeat-containing protein [Phycisphaerae bacterium]
MYARLTTLGLLLSLTLPAAAQTPFNWTGNQNNNWDNSGNWTNQPGFPDSTVARANFDSTGSHRNIDLRGGDRNVGALRFTLDSGADYSFDSNSGGSGIIRLNGDLDMTAAGESVTFHDGTSDPDGGNGISLIQAAPGAWENIGAVFTVYANLGGGEQIDMFGDVTFSHANDYTGNFTIHSGVTTLGNSNAFANAVVTLTQNHGLDVSGLAIANLGALEGDSTLDIGGAVLNVGGVGGDRTFSGNLTGSGFMGAAFEYSGTNQFTLSGAVSGMNSITVASGELRFSGNNATLEGDADLILTGGGVFVVNGALLNVNPLGGAGGQVTLNSNTLTIDAGTLATGTILSNAGGAIDLTDPPFGIALIVGQTSPGGQPTTFAGQLTGTGGFNKVGAGSWTLTHANTFSGDAVIDDGSVIVANANALQNATVQINTDNGLDIVTNAVNANVGGLEGAGGLDIGSQTLSLFGTGTNYSGVISGAGSLLKLTSGSQILSGASTFTGGVTVLNGRLELRDSAAAGAGDITASSGTLAYGNGVNVANAITRTFSDNFTFQMGGGQATQSGVISDSGGQLGFTKVGVGSLRLTAANTYSGTTDIDSGRIIVANADALQNSTVSINVDNGLDVVINDVDANLGGLAGVGNLNIGAQTISVGANNADTTYSGVLSGGGSLTKVGTGALTLAGSLANLDTLRNIGGGVMNIDGGGDTDVLQAAAGNANIRGGVFNLNGESANALHVSGTGAATIEAGAVVTLTGVGGLNRAVLTSNAILTIQDSGSTLVTPRLDIGPSGAGGAEVIAQLDGTINADRIRIGDLAGDDGAAGSLSVLSGGNVVADQTILLRRGTIDISNATLSTDTLIDGDAEAHVISISDPVSGAALTVGANDGGSVVDALIEDASGGPGSIRKVGAGTLELRNANTYSGGAVIDGGTVLANSASGSATGGGGVTVNSGGTLGGVAAAGMTVVNAGGTVAPGASTGELTLGDVSFNPNATLAIELAAQNDFDRLVVSGTAVLAGTLDLSYLGGFTASPNDSFVIVSAANLSGTFDSVIFPDGRNWSITYSSGAPGSVMVGLCPDADADGVCDADDICPGGNDNIDTDGDGVPDGCDACPGFDDNADIDDDGVPDACDTCANFQSTVATAQELIDAMVCANNQPDPNTIYLDADITLTVAENNTYGAAGLPVVVTPIVIEGQGHVIERDASATEAFRLVSIGATGDLTLHESTLRNGLSDLGATPNYRGGGAVYVNRGELTMSDSVLTDNEGPGHGGAIFLALGHASLDRVTITGNSSPNGGNGGAIELTYGGELIVNRSIIAGNQSDFGGAIAVAHQAGQATITNTMITGNARSGVYANGALTMVNSTVAGNASNALGGVNVGPTGNVTVRNSLIYGNSSTGDYPPIVVDGALNIDFTGIAGGVAGVTGAGVVNDNGGNLTLSGGDSVFVSLMSSTNAPTTNGDYHLASDSVAIDVGNNDAATTAGLITDIDGDNRIILGTVDLGADEVAPCADADGDGVCDADDICPGSDDNIDTDGDGVPDGCDACPEAPNAANVTQNAAYPNIQAALDAAGDGDVIELGACTFYEDDITFPAGVNLTLVGAGRDLTIVDGGGSSNSAHPILHFAAGGQTSATVISDLTIRNGVNTETGGGAVVIESASPVFRRVNFVGNGGPGAGNGGAHVRISYTSSPVFDRCVFTGGVDANAAIFANFSAGPVLLLQCLVADNTTNAAVFGYTAPYSIVNSTISATGTTDGYAIRVIATTASCVNTAIDGAIETSSAGVIDADHCLFPGAGGVNIDGAPTFVDAAGGDYALAPGSLGIDAADFDAYTAIGGGATDLVGNPRTFDSCTADSGFGSPAYLDIGAYERQDDGPDSDSDGAPDSCDICPGFDDNLDADTDGVPDGCDACPGFDDNLDADIDGVPDGCDLCPDFDDNLDSDSDGVPDGCDLCPGF